ncbi:flagellar export chaperone FliS [Parasphingorhabdus flavimaris]|jgi:flagellar secretion chaperone FliS|uniref:flagellar export chaperone FliS n=1 Tax=Parasphingorhabdus flavimaris TaxID=266812 RepID=UPI0030010BA6|tara:strand:+ start:803 stop:1198 length:396 start_codon:yes stop_codon:yes gene_type:complete
MTFQSRIQRASSYQSVAKDSRVLAADPYELVAMLFEELRETLDLMIDSARRGDDARIFRYRAKALAILGGLDESLNFEVAGDLAQTLHVIYSEAAKRIQMDGPDSRIERVESAREMIHEIEKAWTAIAPFR